MALKIRIYNDRKSIIPIIIALLLGIAFWFYAKTDSVVTTKAKYPVEFITHKNLILIETSTDSVTLKIKGKLRLQQMLRTISPRIKVSYNYPGVLTIPVEKNTLIFPAWLKIKDFTIIEPESIKVHLDSIAFKKVKVILSKGLESDPQKITIKGPKSLIKDIDYLSPDSIPTGNITTITIDNKLIEVKPNRVRIKR